MTDRPILQTAADVRAALAGRKTQARVILKPQPCMLPSDAGLPAALVALDGYAIAGRVQPKRLPYAPGDRLWVREHWRCPAKHDATAPRDLTPRSMTIAFEAGGSIANQDSRDDWRPSSASYTGADWMGRFRQAMHMPRWASRLTLIVTDVRVQRLQDISTIDCKAEGTDPDLREAMDAAGKSELAQRQAYHDAHVSDFAALWTHRHGPGAWDRNDWVAAITFDVLARNIDAVAL